jgi:hypothetical protein
MMLLQPVHINTAMSLGANGVTLALHTNGYVEDVVSAASFAGMTANGCFVYHCTYFDTDTRKNEDCMVYVHYNNRNVLVAEY